MSNCQSFFFNDGDLASCRTDMVLLYSEAANMARARGESFMNILGEGTSTLQEEIIPPIKWLLFFLKFYFKYTFYNSACKYFIFL